MWCFYRRHQAENHSYVNDTTLPNIQSQELQREMSRLSVDGCSPGPTHLKVILRELLFTDQGSIHRELLHDQGHSSRSAQNLGMASLKLGHITGLNKIKNFLHSLLSSALPMVSALSALPAVPAFSVISALLAILSLYHFLSVIVAISNVGSKSSSIRLDCSLT
ncbi:hypothetical protein Tco_1484039 [Tanacetum coccineum]